MVRFSVCRLGINKYHIACYLISYIIAYTIVNQYSLSQQTIVQQKVSAQLTSNFLTYENPTYGIKMQYPADWTASTNSLETYSGIIGFYSPLQNLTDVLPAQVSLSIRTYSQNVSLDEYTNITLAAVKQQGLELGESNAFTLDGKPGHRIILSPPINAPITFSVMQAWTVIGNKVYLLSYNAEGSEFQNYLPIVQQMLSSLQIQQT